MPHIRKRLWFLLAMGTCLLVAAFMLLFYINTSRTSPVIAAATATRVPPTHTAALPEMPTATPQLHASFGTLGEVDQITIINDYDTVVAGYTQRHISLHRTDTGFTGQAQFVFKYYSDSEVEAQRPVAFGWAEAQTFFRALEDIAKIPATASPSPIPATDCYPDIRIRLEARAGMIEFSTKTCGAERWTVNDKGRPYLIDTKEPLMALNALEPYLREDVIDSLFDHHTPRP